VNGGRPRDGLVSDGGLHVADMNSKREVRLHTNDYGEFAREMAHYEVSFGGKLVKADFGGYNGGFGH